jgi:hypothetical protein
MSDLANNKNFKEEKFMNENIKIDTSQTPEKFLHMKEELVPPLFEILRKLDEIEKKYYAISREIDAERENGEDVYQRDRKNWADYKAAREDAVAALITEKCKVSSGSLSEPSEYAYMSDGSSPRVYFIMKSAKRAVTEIFYGRQNHQFVWKNTDNGWKIDSKKYGFDGDTWYGIGI